MKKSTYMRLQKSYLNQIFTSIKIWLRNLPIVFCAIGAMTFSAPTFAETGDTESPLIKAIDNLRKDMVTRFDTLKARLEDLFINASNSLTTSSQQPNLVINNPANAFQFTQDATGGTTIKPLPVYNLVAQAIRQSTTDKLKASLSPGNQDAQRQVLLQPPTNNADATVNMLDTQGLLGPLVYADSTQQNLAERTIAFFSDYANPVGSIDMEQLHQKPELENGRAGQSYKVKTFTQTAIRSLLLSNLYESFSARTPVKNLGKMSGMPNKNDASLAEVLHYIATRRVSDPDWYTSINTAPPIIVARETAYMLGEIENQLYILHRDNERLLQTMTAIAVLNLRSSKLMADQDEIQLKQAVEGTLPEEPTGDTSENTE